MTNQERVDRVVKAVSCSHCGSQRGDYCLGKHGFLKSSVHHVRRVTAREALQSDKPQNVYMRDYLKDYRKGIRKRAL